MGVYKSGEEEGVFGEDMRSYMLIFRGCRGGGGEEVRYDPRGGDVCGVRLENGEFSEDRRGDECACVRCSDGGSVCAVCGDGAVERHDF